MPLSLSDCFTSSFRDDNGSSATGTVSDKDETPSDGESGWL